MKGVRCRQCQRPCRSRAIFLFETLKGPAYVCGRACYAAYNGTDKPEEPCACAAHSATRVAGSRAPRRARA